MDRTSDQTSIASSRPVHTIDQTLPLVPQGRPNRPDLIARAYMEQHPINSISKALNRYGQSGRYGHLNDSNGSGRPDLSLMVGTVRTGGMFHANPSLASRADRGQGRWRTPLPRVLLGFANCGLASAQSSCMFRVPSLVPMEHGGSA